MRTTFACALILLLSVTMSAGSAAGQTAHAPDLTAALSAPDLAPASTAAQSATLPDRVITALGGALLGAGAGFFASQVVKGDWDDKPGQPSDRPVWAAVGGSVGFALGFSFPVSGRSGRPTPRAERAPSQVITADEIRRATARDAHEAIRVLRPQWLVTRGTHVFGETTETAIQVYLDGNLLGGVRTLRDVNATTIASIQFLDAAAATLRWGAGHSHGAILIIGN